MRSGDRILRITQAGLDSTADRLYRQRRRLQRSALGRRVARRRLLAALAALLTAWAVTHQVTAAQAARDAWGNTVQVLVATRDLAAGEAVDPGSVTLEQVPSRFVPPGALSSPPEGRRVNAPIGRGEMLLDTRLAPRGVGATAAALPVGADAVTVALNDAPPPLRPGDALDAVAISSVPDLVTSLGPAPPAEVVAEHAIVMEVAPGRVTLAVRRDQVTATLSAAAAGRLHLVITG